MSKLFRGKYYQRLTAWNSAVFFLLSSGKSGTTKKCTNLICNQLIFQTKLLFPNPSPDANMQVFHMLRKKPLLDLQFHILCVLETSSHSFSFRTVHKKSQTSHECRSRNIPQTCRMLPEQYHYISLQGSCITFSFGNQQ